MSFGSKSLAPPTKFERERMDALKNYGWCVACCTFGPVELHHLLSKGGLRLGHRYTVSLCRPCHSAVKTRAFKALNTDQAMLDASDYILACNSTPLPTRRQRNRKSKTTSSKMLPRRYGP